MTRVLFCVLMILLGSSIAVAADKVPAGYIMSVKLVGEDAAKGTSVVRSGAELPPKLMMPLYAGDVVFVRTPESRIGIELGDGATADVGGSVMRRDITGEVDTGDGTWSIIAAIADVISGVEDMPPDNMVSRGGALTIPMAARGRNFLLAGRRTLWIGWRGGTAPFAVALEAEGEQVSLQAGIEKEDAEVRLPDHLPKRFNVIIKDAQNLTATIRFQFADALPVLPSGMTGYRNSGADGLAAAAWLTSQSNGAWVIEAAQMLRALNSPAANALLAEVRSGWMLEQ